jgi:hypothetical protein
MANAAILVGNIDYHNLAKLDCCRDDLLAIKQLLEETEKYEEITVIEDADADSLKSQLRAAVDKVKSPEELFFYFTGHGYQHETEFIHCATNFDPKRPNETGISTTELHTLLRLANAALVVKTIDACNSGTLLVKSENGWIAQTKNDFKNLIQIASCLDSQTSLTGHPLSLFTEKFRNAALRKTEGVVYYTDIINTLRDEFLNNNSQTPFFVSQHTGREQFVDDAARLDKLRESLMKELTAETDSPIVTAPATQIATLLERLRATDAKVVTPNIMADLVGNLFDKLIQTISTSEFSDFFQFAVTEHARFVEATTEQFIIRVMSNEKRDDNFVTAVHSRKLRRNLSLALAASSLFGDDAFEETWHLTLNCTMERTQLRITLTPKFINLQRIVLVISCAPSLDHCYIFEIGTQHLLQDFGRFDAHGAEVSRRWWKVNWRASTESIVAQISEKLAETIRRQLEDAEKRLVE